MNPCYTYPAKARLKSRKIIEKLFSSGGRLSSNEFRLFYLIIPNKKDDQFLLQMGLGIPKKRMPSAVNRNRIKRQMREAYRLLRPTFQEHLTHFSYSVYLFLIYHGDEMPTFKRVSSSVELLLNHLLSVLARSHEEKIH